jgi:hypothetical protein
MNRASKKVSRDWFGAMPAAEFATLSDYTGGREPGVGPRGVAEESWGANDLFDRNSL